MTQASEAQRDGPGRKPPRGALARALLVATLLTLGAGGIAADRDVLRGVANELRDGGRAPVLSINDAVSRVQDRFGGQVISILPSVQDNQRGYRVKVLLDNGRVKTLFVNSGTGQVIDRRGRN